MSTDTPGGARMLGTLRPADGAGVVRLEDRFDADADDLWSALTEPERLSRWLGEVAGDLRQGGEFRGRYFASGWEGTCRVEVCEPPRRLLITLRPDGVRTVLVIEDRGMPLDQVAAYAAGDQIHVEDLASYLAGGEPCDARSRWTELHPAYEQMAPGLP